MKNIDEMRRKIIKNCKQENLEFLEEFEFELRNDKTVEIVDALSKAGFSYYRIVEIILFYHYTVFENCYDVTDVAMAYLYDKEYITDDMPKAYVDIPNVLYHMEMCGYIYVPFGIDKYIFITKTERDYYYA